ncbi:carboxypeptidase-like regulatory domain-containing protein [Limibacter armeniacum]|uniref:carboxypeptidase-like regulatory domain-containing protein n=1 Tax=Limibacter armeniacum TaxID=466084 RepID=UPI002FE65874
MTINKQSFVICNWQTILFIYIITLFIGLPLQAQQSITERKISVSIQEETVDQVLAKLGKEGDFDFTYNTQLFPKNKRYTVMAKDEAIDSILNRTFGPDGIAYKPIGSQIIFYRKKVELPERKERKVQHQISGVVSDAETDTPVQGVLVSIGGLGLQTTTDTDGTFSFQIDNPNINLTLSFREEIYNTKQVKVKVKDDQSLNIKLTPAPLPEAPITVKPDIPKALELTTPLATAPLDQLKMVQLFVPENAIANVDKAAESLIHSFGQVSLVPMVGSSFYQNSRSINTLSLNIFAGYAAGLEGFEVGTVLNFERYNVKGGQIAGAANIVGGSVSGGQIAGAFNLSRYTVGGLQIAGALNIANQQMSGLQLAGITNIVTGRLKGVQLAGINNILTEGGCGFQLAGITNTTAKKQFTGAQVTTWKNVAKGAFDGLQLSLVANKTHVSSFGWQTSLIRNAAKGDFNGIQTNLIINKAYQNYDGMQLSLIANDVDKEMQGLQIGLVNVADTLSGVQAGLVNVSTHVKNGAPIGLLSFVKNGYQVIDINVKERTNITLNYKTGLRKFYNIISIGGQVADSLTVMAGYGIGTAPKIWKWIGLNFDGTLHYVQEGDDWFKYMNFLGSLTSNLTIDIIPTITIFGGGSINGQISKMLEEGQNLTSSQPHHPFYQKVDNDQRLVSCWWGFQGGIRFTLNGKKKA